jgi:hypothetical protein
MRNAARKRPTRGHECLRGELPQKSPPGAWRDWRLLRLPFDSFRALRQENNERTVALLGPVLKSGRVAGEVYPNEMQAHISEFSYKIVSFVYNLLKINVIYE